MAEFDLTLKIAGNDYRFHFSEIISGNDIKYFVQGRDGGAQSQSFEIKKNRLGKWTIIQPAPKWILDVENLLIEAILKRRKE